MAPDASALAAARRIVEEVLAAHEARDETGVPGGPDERPVSDAVLPAEPGTDELTRGATAGSAETDARRPGSAAGTTREASGAHGHQVRHRPDTPAWQAARRIVEEVLQDHASRTGAPPPDAAVVDEVVVDLAADLEGPPPPPTAAVQAANEAIERGVVDQDDDYWEPIDDGDPIDTGARERDDGRALERDGTSSPTGGGTGPQEGESPADAARRIVAEVLSEHGGAATTPGRAGEPVTGTARSAQVQDRDPGIELDAVPPGADPEPRPTADHGPAAEPERAPAAEPERGPDVATDPVSDRGSEPTPDREPEPEPLFAAYEATSDVEPTSDVGSTSERAPRAEQPVAGRPAASDEPSARTRDGSADDPAEEPFPELFPPKDPAPRPAFEDDLWEAVEPEAAAEVEPEAAAEVEPEAAAEVEPEAAAEVGPEAAAEVGPEAADTAVDGPPPIPEAARLATEHAEHLVPPAPPPADPAAPSNVAARIVAEVLAARAQAELDEAVAAEVAASSVPDTAAPDGAETTDELAVGPAIVADARAEAERDASGEDVTPEVFHDEAPEVTRQLERPAPELEPTDEMLAQADPAGATEEMASTPVPVGSMPASSVGTEEPWTDDSWVEQPWPDESWSEQPWSDESWSDGRRSDEPATDAPWDDPLRQQDAVGASAWGDERSEEPAWVRPEDEPTSPVPVMSPPPPPPRRTGRWLLTTILGAIGLALLFPLAIGALLDLVALN